MQDAQNFGSILNVPPKTAIWFNLGKALDSKKTVQDWQSDIGMDFTVHESNALFEAKSEIRVFPDKKVLFRSDNNLPLSIVGQDFKVVQPAEVLEFFRDVVENHGMKLASAGMIFEGRRFWALADTGRTDEVMKGDVVERHLLLTTSIDGTMSTVGKIVNNRSISNSTLQVAIGEAGNYLKVTHKKHFDAKSVKINLTGMDQKWNGMVNNLKKLASIEMPEEETRKFFEDRYFDDSKAPYEQTWGVNKTVNKIVDLAFHGHGAFLSAGSRWGALCGATEYFTHGTGKRDLNHQFWDSYMGNQANQKFDIYRELVMQ